MVLISPVTTKRGVPTPGISSDRRQASFSTYRPSLSRSSFSASSARQAGWVKSPVPTRPMPFRLAHRSRCSGTHWALVAREYLEWICRSAIIPLLLSAPVRRIKYPRPSGRGVKGCFSYSSGMRPAICSLIFWNVSSDTSCSIRQASSAAVSGETPRATSHLHRKRCRS